MGDTNCVPKYIEAKLRQADRIRQRLDQLYDETEEWFYERGPAKITGGKNPQHIEVVTYEDGSKETFVHTVPWISIFNKKPDDAIEVLNSSWLRDWITETADEKANHGQEQD